MTLVSRQAFLVAPAIALLLATSACSRPTGAESPPSSSPEVTVAAAKPYSTTLAERRAEIAPERLDRAIDGELERLAAERAAGERRANEERLAEERSAAAERFRRAAMEPTPGTVTAPASRPADDPGETASPTEPVPTDRFRAIPLERPPVERTREVSLLVPAGARLEVELEDSLSSQTSRPGDLFAARLVAPVSVDGYFAFPVGARVEGHVEEVERARRIGGQASLLVVFDRLLLPDGEVPLSASLYDEARGETKRDAATIGGATVAGAILGRAIGDRNRTRGGTIGALIGAAIGTGIAASRPGEAIELPAGTPLTLVLEEEVPVRVGVRVLEVG